MDKISKSLSKLSKKERKLVKQTMLQLQKGNFKNLDLKKLKGRKDIFRVRKGQIRIIYQISKSGIFILAIERRSEKTYK